MKAAPEGGAALLSGVYDRKTLTELGRDLPMSRFLYMADTLQSCCAALADSIRPRTAAELCLLRLCDESLSGDLTAFDRRLARLEQARTKAEKAAMTAARALSDGRRQAAERLSTQILEELRQLDMGKIRFAVDITEKPLGADGIDQVRFLMSANVGEELRPIHKIASGGELARIMLAMKNVLSEQDMVGTLVFDEVDTGVSGRAAQKVAEKMARISRRKQVLCVTHLPQLAALADNHLLIAKQERNGRTYTSVTPLDLEGRKRELARIIGGATITETTLKSAEEMLRG